MALAADGVVMRIVAFLAMLAICLPLVPTGSAGGPAIVASASVTPNGVELSWTAGPVDVDAFQIKRMQPGGPLTDLATVEGTTFAYVDPDGVEGDIYLVVGVLGGRTIFTSNPAVGVIKTQCPPFGFQEELPYVWWNIDCIGF